MVYDYEYHQGFLSQFLLDNFISTKKVIVGEASNSEKQVIQTWNSIFERFDLKQFTVSPANIVLTSSRASLYTDYSKSHVHLLDFGMDAITLKLFYNRNNAPIDALSDLVKSAVFAYKIAEACDRSIESTYFAYLAANKLYSFVKDNMLIISFHAMAYGFFFVG